MNSDRRHLLTRRQTIGAAAGLAGAALVAGRGPLRGVLPGSAAEPDRATAASCVLTPEKTEGPYFVDELLNRSDIRTNSDGSNARPGVPLALEITVLRIDDDCAPATGAVVDVWHCDAGGLYSDVAQNGTTGQDFLRGLQATDANGKARFTTIFPGWYVGRAVHVHFKVRTFEDDQQTYEFTSQLFFDQAIVDAVEATPDYTGTGTTQNSQDSIYAGDSEVVVPLSGSVNSGYTGAITVGLSGLPARGDVPGDDEVGARLLSTGFSEHHGRRLLRLKLRSDERITAEARLVRGGRTLARRRRRIGPGRSRLRLALPGAVEGGPARLRVELGDAAGNRKTIKRTVHVPD
jgi:protocatechuate 3,4-dioxygenase beta subunit